MDFLFLILWSLALGFLSLIFITYRTATYWHGKGIAYATSLPIIGIFLPVFMRRISFPNMILNLYKKYPNSKYFGFMDNNYPALLIRDPEIIKEIAVKYFDYFPNHRSFVKAEFDPLLSRNLFSLKDDRWRDIRSTLSPSFTANKMKFMFTLVSKCSMEFVQHLKDHPDLIEEFDMKDAYTRFTNDVIATSAFGISVNSMKDRNNEFYENGKLASIFDFKRFLKFVASRNFPTFMRIMGMTFLPKKADIFFKKIIHDTVKVREENGIARPDMIHLLLQARNNDNNIEITTDDIIAQAVLFFIAGFDTSSRLMCFISHVLAHHPDVQARLCDEVRVVLNEEDGEISYEALGKMKYLDMVISETVRLYPPMPFIDRVCSKEYILPPSMEGTKEFHVQPDTPIWFPIFGLHRDEKYFSQPDEFDPERFNADNKNNIEQGAYIPFGLGPRKCIGDRFALMETKIVVVKLLQHFVFKPSSKSPKVIEFSKKFLDMSPANGFWMTLEARK